MFYNNDRKYIQETRTNKYIGFEGNHTTMHATHVSDNR